MRRHGVQDIFAFDRGFDRVEGVTRLPGSPGKRKEGEAE